MTQEEEDLADITLALLLDCEFYQYQMLQPIGWWVVRHKASVFGEHPTQGDCARAYLAGYKHRAKAAPA